MISSAISLFTRNSPEKRLPPPPNIDAPTARGEKRNAPASPAVSDETVAIIPDITIFAEKIAILGGRVSSLADLVDHQSDRIHNLEKTVEHQKVISKSSNLIVYGIPETLDDGNVRQLFAGDRDLPSLISNIVETYRLGHFKANAARPRPTLVKFDSPRARNAAFKHSRRLRGRSLNLAEDLTPGQQEVRRHLLPHYQAFRAQGYTVLWLGATLCFRQANGRVHLWVPGEPPPGPPPARASQEARAPQARPQSRAAPKTNTTAQVVQPPNREPRGPAQPMRDLYSEIQPAPLSEPSLKTVVKGRARALATEPPQKSSTTVRENARNAALQPTNLNAPRTRTAAAHAGEALGVRPQQAPGGRTAFAAAGRAPDAHAMLP